MAASDGLTVAVTGPTGDLGIALVSRLERSRSVRRVVGDGAPPVRPRRARLAEDRVPPGRRAGRGQRARRRSKDADVVVHLAFSILGAGDATRAINVDGSRSVFEAAADAGARAHLLRVERRRVRIPRRQPDRGSARTCRRAGPPSTSTRSRRPRSSRCSASVLDVRTGTAPYVFRPCIVAGPNAQMPLERCCPTSGCRSGCRRR